MKISRLAENCKPNNLLELKIKYTSKWRQNGQIPGFLPKRPDQKFNINRFRLQINNR